MNCKYPVESRSYKACVLCSDKNICENSTIVNNATTLLSASEAHKKTTDNIKNCLTKELAEISKKKLVTLLQMESFLLVMMVVYNMKQLKD